MDRKIDSRLSKLGIELPEPASPVANFVPFVVSANLVFISGQGPQFGSTMITGKLGADVVLETGQKAARYCALNLLAHLKVACDGDLDKVKRVVKLGGFVNCTSDFTDQPKIVNGASDLMVEVFGDAGGHARFAVGAPSLPGGIAVEVDGIFEIITAE